MKILLPSLVCFASITASHAAVSFTGSPIIEDFSSYDGTAAPTGWDATGFSSGAGFSENRGASSGGVTTGGAYAFTVATGNVALGVQPGGSDFTPGSYILEVVNNSGSTVSAWNVDFISYFFNDEDRGNTLGLSFSTDGSSYTTVPSSSFESGAAPDVSPTWQVGVDFSGTINASVADGSSLFLSWDFNDASGSGSRDEFAIDDISISQVPEASITLFGALGAFGLLRRRR